MAEQMRPASKQDAPDPARSYERAKPEAESGMGRLDTNPHATPTGQPDKMSKAVKNAQEPRQINAHEVVNERAARAPSTLPPTNEPDHSMLEEEPDGWDQAPTDIKDQRQKRHPRTEGKGGTR